VAVAVQFGGICGTDLHYWHEGRVGDFRLAQPLTLGHEVVGAVAALGEGVDGPPEGTPVAIHPARVCRRCPRCREGRRNLCQNVRYLGSAARFPHVQGGFSERLVAPADQVVALPPGLPLELAVLAEPLAVALHAVHRAGDVLGRRVLITGAGPIGCLAAAAARAAGAAEVLVTDLVEGALQVASAVGATRVLRAGNDQDPPDGDADVVIEASGAPAALRTATRSVRRGGTLVLLGLLPPGEISFAGNLAVTGEIDVRGSFRFDTEFDEALSLLAGGLPVQAVVTGTVPLSDAPAAFELAADRARTCKVLLDLTA